MVLRMSNYHYLFCINCIIIIISLMHLKSITADDIHNQNPAIRIEGSLEVKPSVTRGMMIDAGSGGSRLHVYRWAPRIFNTVPPPISFVTADEKWTGKMTPGIATFVNNLDGIRDHLKQLIDFAKSVLDYEDDFSEFPLFFKATGGVRELSVVQRESVLNKVRELLSDKSFNPFYFRNDFARVISGEEEAIYSWAGVNFLLGTLLDQSQGSGAVSSPNKTYSTLDLGGSSTQIAFFQPNQDIMEGLFKLQIGGQKHWNVYSKSFLQFGINSARKRFLDTIVNNYISDHSGNIPAHPTSVSYCFHSGYSERVHSSEDSSLYVDISGPPVPVKDQFNRCVQELTPLLFMNRDKSKAAPKKKNLFSSSSSYCEIVYHGECSMGGAYQPALDYKEEFIGTSSYTYPWKFLMLPQTAKLEQFRQRASDICKMNFNQIQEYYERNNLNLVKDKLSDYMPYYCFISSYVLVLLTDGYGFNMSYSLTVVDELNGNKVGWALGAMLYEINALPYEYRPPDLGYKLKMYLIAALTFITGILLGTYTTKRFGITKYYSRIHKEFRGESEANDIATKAKFSSYSSNSNGLDDTSALLLKIPDNLGSSSPPRDYNSSASGTSDGLSNDSTPPRNRAHSYVNNPGGSQVSQFSQYGSLASTDSIGEQNALEDDV